MVLTTDWIQNGKQFSWKQMTKSWKISLSSKSPKPYLSSCPTSWRSESSQLRSSDKRYITLRRFFISRPHQLETNLLNSTMYSHNLQFIIQSMHYSIVNTRSNIKQEKYNNIAQIIKIISSIIKTNIL